MEINIELKRIRAFVFDMDGVLTDGTVFVHGDGQWIRRMHIRDGYALQLAVRHGYHVAVISGSDAPPVRERLAVLGVQDVYMKSRDKSIALAEFITLHDLSYEEVLFMGDDVPDIQSMRNCGIAACPADAAFDVLGTSDIVTTAKGGDGCVREVIERVLRFQDRWSDDSHVRSI